MTIFEIFLLTTTVFLLFNFITRDKTKNDTYYIILQAIKTHSNRGLQFTKGKTYTFYKTGDHLTLNADDISQYRDNYSFYKRDLEEGFKTISVEGAKTMKNIRAI